MKVFARSELRRIDEHRDDRHVAFGPRAIHQAEMAFVQRAHRRHQADRLARLPGSKHCFAQLRRLGDDARRREVAIAGGAVRCWCDGRFSCGVRSSVGTFYAMGAVRA